ncbi:MAG TPA: isochorismatase family cysteine hydrolase [Candidatus Limnocylindria bacterium]|nr:isochorismatase family cysteine hydrolase [Candidatus Limnocylindria bacterium]
MTPVQRRPADHWPITPNNTALVIVDMQNIWVHPRGARYLPMSEDIVPKVQTLLGFCRANRVPVIYLHTTKRKDLADVGIFADIKPQTHDADDEWSNFEGSIGAEFYEPVKPADGDIVVKKFRYSGFYGTHLENLLRALGRDTIAIAGVATNVCCDSTARDGAMRDFKVLFLSDCNASFTQEEQEATLNNFDKHFGVVMDSRALIARLEKVK